MNADLCGVHIEINLTTHDCTLPKGHEGDHKDENATTRPMLWSDPWKEFSEGPERMNGGWITSETARDLRWAAKSLRNPKKKDRVWCEMVARTMEKAANELDAWELTEKVRSHPDYEKQKAEFEKLESEGHLGIDTFGGPK